MYIQKYYAQMYVCWFDIKLNWTGKNNSALIPHLPMSSCYEGILLAHATFIFFINFYRALRPMIYAKFDHWGVMLSLLKFVSFFFVCVPKSAAPAGNWTQDYSLLGWMLYQLRVQMSIQCLWCPSVLLVSDGPSSTLRGATLSNTQHTIFVLFWAHSLVPVP